MNSEFEKYWEVEDPDLLLTRSIDEVASMEFNGFICNEIIPRERLFQAKNIETGALIELGYYDRDPTKNGVWVIHVIGPELDWKHPIEKASNLSLSNALACLKDRLKQYAMSGE